MKFIVVNFLYFINNSIVPSIRLIPAECAEIDIIGTLIYIRTNNYTVGYKFHNLDQSVETYEKLINSMNEAYDKSNVQIDVRNYFTCTANADYLYTKGKISELQLKSV